MKLNPVFGRSDDSSILFGSFSDALSLSPPAETELKSTATRVIRGAGREGEIERKESLLFTSLELADLYSDSLKLTQEFSFSERREEKSEERRGERKRGEK